MNTIYRADFTIKGFSNYNCDTKVANIYPFSIDTLCTQKYYPYRYIDGVMHSVNELSQNAGPNTFCMYSLDKKLLTIDIGLMLVTYPGSTFKVDLSPTDAVKLVKLYCLTNIESRNLLTSLENV